MDATAVSRTFFDTNVILYAFDHRDPAKQARAASLLTELAGSIVISGQVLGEFYWIATRKLGLAYDEARAAIAWLSRLIVIPIDTDMVLAAIELGHSASIAYWDALIVGAAASAGCRRVLTEDLNHGQIIDGVRVENPFIKG